jgi:hypothetical protein
VKSVAIFFFLRIQLVVANPNKSNVKGLLTHYTSLSRPK